MMLKYFYDEALAHASYFVGCQKDKVAIVIDPERNVSKYVAWAKKHDMQIIGVAETHIHADFVSGARELADCCDAKLYLSDAGPADWKYGYADEYSHQMLRDGDRFRIGRLEFDVIHTPGHTPESLSFVLTDRGGGADEPMGIFTGDFVFVGSIGRPDLLEKSAGQADSARPAAVSLYQSIQRFKELPEFLQVWPAHGAGSACGKGLGAIPSSTIGYEMRFNEALQFDDENQFVEYILADQPEPPTYFARMKRVNKEGPALLSHSGLPELSAEDLHLLEKSETIFMDVSQPEDFAAGHLPHSLNMPLHLMGQWAGWFTESGKLIYLIGTSDQTDEAIRILREIGVGQLAGRLNREKLDHGGHLDATLPTVSPEAVQEQIESGEIKLIDVRSAKEHSDDHIDGAENFFLGALQDEMTALSRDQKIVAQCQTGNRSSIAASLLKANGFDVMNLQGGIEGWRESVRSQPAM